MVFPKILLKSLLAVGSIGAATLGGVGLKGLMNKKTDSQGEEVGREQIPSKKELTEEQKTLVKNVKVPARCKYPDEVCELTIGELKLINFSNKQENQELTLTPDNVVVSLTITELSDKEKAEFNNKSIKFNFKVSNPNLDIKNGDNDSNKISLLKNTNYEFKINDQSKLEKAWSSGEEMGKKIGLGDLAPTQGSPKSFSLVTAKLNIFFENKPFKQLTPTQKSLNLQLEENQEGFNNGFKYSTPSEIQFENGDGTTVKLEAQKGYEIKFIGDDWYLSKVVESVSERRQ